MVAKTDLSSMLSISAQEKQIIQEFEQLESVDEKYLHLFKIADALPELEAGLKTEENQVKGCQSTVWFFATFQDGGMRLQADSDSMVIKAISALIVRLVEGRPPAEVLNVNLNFLDEMSIWKLASRQNPGLAAIIGHLHAIARAKLDDCSITELDAHVTP